MPNKKRPLLWFLGFIWLVASLGCSKPNERHVADQQKIKILATTTIVQDLVLQSMGEIADVDVLMGPGTDPHLYVPSPRDYTKIKTASIVVYSGLGLEAKLGELLKSLSPSKNIIDLSRFVPKEKVIVDSTRAPDPHYWFDPELWLSAGEGFAKRMQINMPQHKAVIRENFSRWRRAVNEATHISRDLFLKVPLQNRVLITSHDAFRYYGRFFDLEVMSVLGVSTDAQVSIKKIEKLISFIKSKKIPAIFLETSVSPYAIQRIQEEASVSIGGELYGDSLGGPSTTASTYVGMLRHNSTVVAQALGEIKK